MFWKKPDKRPLGAKSVSPCEHFGITESSRKDKPRLIYDVGMHVGQDTAFYLAKGFNVVAVEANPLLARAGEKKFSSFIRDGRLTILNVGIGAEAGVFPFYVNDTLSEWSSFNKEIGAREGKFHEITVECVTFGSSPVLMNPNWYRA